MRPVPSPERTQRIAGVAFALIASSLAWGVAVAPARAVPTRYALAGGCYSLRSSLLGRPVAKGPSGYAVPAAGATAEPFHMQATALGTYLLYDPQKQFAAGAGGRLTAAAAPSDSAVWRVDSAGAGKFTLTSSLGGKVLAVAGDGALVLADAAGAGDAARFSFEPATGCASYPEVEVNATGTPSRGTNPETEVMGTVDGHAHLTAFEFIGGNFHCGRPWHPFGVVYALPDCATIDGPQGSAAPFQNFVDYGKPAAKQDTRGWPTFHDWPARDQLTKEGTYYKAVERAWKAGLRVMVTQLVDNEALCQLMSTKHNPCNDMNSVHIQARDMYELQDYIDAQSGGPGKGWFRIVFDPFEARRVINDGKLAVVLGIEVSRLFGCGVHTDVPECGRAQVDRGLDEVFQPRGARLVPDPQVRQRVRRHQDGRRRIRFHHQRGEQAGDRSFWHVRRARDPRATTNRSLRRTPP